MKHQKEFRQIDLTGKVYGEFDLDEIERQFMLSNELTDRLKKAQRGECIKLPGETFLMKVAD